MFKTESPVSNASASKTNGSDPTPLSSAAVTLHAPARGDSESYRHIFEQIFREHRSGLRRHAQRIVGSPEAAEEVLQEALISTYRHLERGNDIDSVSGWLHTCVHNTALSQLRKRQQPYFQLEDDDSDRFNPAEGVEEKLDESSRCRQVIETLSALPEQQCRAFLLFEVHGLDYKDTAHELGTTTNSVRQLLFRARRNLRERLGPEMASASVPILKASIFAEQTETTVGDRIAGYLADLSGRFSSFFNQLGERWASTSAPAVAALILGAAVVAGQSQGGDSAQGASIDPSSLARAAQPNPLRPLAGQRSQLSSPIGAERVQPAVLDPLSPSPASMHRRRGSWPGGSSGPTRAELDLIKARLKAAAANCKFCKGPLGQLLLSISATADLSRREVAVARYQRRSERRQSRHSNSSGTRSPAQDPDNTASGGSGRSGKSSSSKSGSSGKSKASTGSDGSTSSPKESSSDQADSSGEGGSSSGGGSSESPAESGPPSPGDGPPAPGSGPGSPSPPAGGGGGGGPGPRS